jgi:hypothetical protein
MINSCYEDAMNGILSNHNLHKWYVFVNRHFTVFSAVSPNSTELYRIFSAGMKTKPYKFAFVMKG